MSHTGRGGANHWVWGLFTTIAGYPGPSLCGFKLSFVPEGEQEVGVSLILQFLGPEELSPLFYARNICGQAQTRAQILWLPSGPLAASSAQRLPRTKPQAP